MNGTLLFPFLKMDMGKEMIKLRLRASFVASTQELETFYKRLNRELNRKRMAGEIPEAAGRIIKQRKPTAESATSGATSTAPAAAAEESSRPPAGAALPRLLVLARRRGGPAPA